MSRGVIQFLKEWSPAPRRGPVSEWRAVTPAAAVFDAVPRPASAGRAFASVADASSGAGPGAGALAAADWPQRNPASRQEPMALCHVRAFDGEEVECTVFIDGYEIPRVSFPAWVLKRKKLHAGSRFIWIIRDSQRILPADIDTGLNADALATRDLEELETLYRAFKERLVQDNGAWPEYTGSGR